MAGSYAGAMRSRRASICFCCAGSSLISERRKRGGRRRLMAHWQPHGTAWQSRSSSTRSDSQEVTKQHLGESEAREKGAEDDEEEDDDDDEDDDSDV